MARAAVGEVDWMAAPRCDCDVLTPGFPGTGPIMSRIADREGLGRGFLWGIALKTSELRAGAAELVTGAFITVSTDLELWAKATPEVVGHAAINADMARVLVKSLSMEFTYNQALG